MQRRSVLPLLAAGLAAPRTSHAADAGIRVFVNEPVGKIEPAVHGHFIEHLGGVIYDGVWVGEASKIANVQGIRKALIDAMKPLGHTVMRWPGGCFADSYDWRDGVGASNTRPKRLNFWANNGRMQKVDSSHVSKNDPNKFGTNEFIRFCKLIGTEPYLAGNVRSLTAGDFYQWIEYCNSPSGSTLAERRAANGDAAPFDVRFWGVGNESWGCGGDMTPEEYSVEFRKFTSWVPQYGKPLSYIASGPNGFDYGWSRRFFERLTEKSPRLINRVWGWALHYYCGKTGKGDSLDYTTQDYYELLERANRMEELIEKHWAVMAEFDKEHRVKLAIDEWGAWHNDGTAVAPHHLFGSVPTMRDALIAGLTLDTFHRHAEKVSMANVAQLVNCIQTLFLAHEDKFCVTPTYHVFAMYKDHHNGQAVRALFDTPRIEYALSEKKSQVVRMAGSASVNGRRLTLTAVNNGHADAVDTVIRVDGAKVNSASAVVLAAPDVHAHNHFDRPEEVKPRGEKVAVTAEGMRFRFPAGSVVKLTVELG